MRPTAKRNRSSAAPCLEKALLKWVSNQNIRDVALIGEVVVLQAMKMLDIANVNISESKKLL